VRHGSVTVNSRSPEAWWPVGFEPEPVDR